jgi:hypothetical protein
MRKQTYFKELTALSPQMREYLQDLYVYSQLPMIRGEWFFVDPQNGVSTNDGKSSEKAFANITSAYAACTSGAGDGIVLLSSGTDTADTTSYLEDGEEIDWTKHAITVIGISSGCRSFGRARIANKATTGEALPYLIDVQGDNNAFINISMWNAGTDAAAVGCLKVTGNRNRFENVFAAVGLAAGATANERSLEINGAQENTFINCTFGTDTLDRGNNASAEIFFDGACYRNVFEGCYTYSWVSSGTAHGAVKSADGDTLGRDNFFRDCIFNCFATDQASWFVGTAPTAGKLYVIHSALAGYTAWDSSGANNCVYVGAPAFAASGAGGIPTTI